MNDQKAPVPSIKIFVAEGFAEERVLTEVCCGVEEESVPYEVVRVPAGVADDGVALAWAGASESVLEVGIGVDCKGCVSVHSKRLPAGSPLFKASYIGEFHRVRSLCSNAARLVKGTPFILD